MKLALLSLRCGYVQAEMYSFIYVGKNSSYSFIIVRYTFILYTFPYFLLLYASAISW